MHECALKFDALSIIYKGINGAYTKKLKYL